MVSIFIAPREGAPVVEQDRVKAVEGRGLEGDRYHELTGTFSRKMDPGREVTLIESEAIAALERDFGIAIGLGGSRRNIVTSGVSLNDLVGREFEIGEAAFRGVRLCPPCGLLERMTQRGVKAGLKDRGGLNAQVLRTGWIRRGDPVSVR